MRDACLYRGYIFLPRVMISIENDRFIQLRMILHFLRIIYLECYRRRRLK